MRGDDRDSIRTTVSDAYTAALEKAREQEGGSCCSSVPAGVAARSAGYDEADKRTFDDAASSSFGCGNPRPKLATGWLELAGEPRCVGSGGDPVPDDGGFGAVTPSVLVLALINRRTSSASSRGTAIWTTPASSSPSARTGPGPTPPGTR